MGFYHLERENVLSRAYTLHGKPKGRCIAETIMVDSNTQSSAIVFCDSADAFYLNVIHELGYISYQAR